MSNYRYVDSFDVIAMGSTEAVRHIVVSCKEDKYKIIQEKLWHIIRGDDNSLDYWFTDGKQLRSIFGEGHGFYMTTAISKLFDFLNDVKPDLPVKGISVHAIREIANTSGNYKDYYESLVL